jgi:hypothetical protein
MALTCSATARLALHHQDGVTAGQRNQQGHAMTIALTAVDWIETSPTGGSPAS